MKVLITREIPEAGLKILNIYKDRIEIDYRKGDPLSKEELIKAVKGVDAIVPMNPDQITAEIIDAAGDNLKIIAQYAVGYDNIDVEYATQKKVFVSNTPGSLTESIGEYAIALMFALTRNIVEADKFTRHGKYEFWKPLEFVGPKLSGKTLGIIGFGRIGQHTAKIAKFGLNMKVQYTDLVAHDEAAGILDAERVELEQLLGTSDFISLHCNLTDENRHMMETPQFSLMKPLAYLINTARGALVNELALVTALKEGVIAGAALDVFEHEPKISSELKKLSNVIITPHIASATWEARIQMSRMVAENIVDVLINKKPPRYLVNKSVVDTAITSLS